MRSRASTAQRAMAISATTTVIGLLRAARTRRMWVSFLRQSLPDGRGSDRSRGSDWSGGAYRSRDREGAIASSGGLGNEGLNIAGGGGHPKQSAPDGEAGPPVA